MGLPFEQGAFGAVGVEFFDEGEPLVECGADCLEGLLSRGVDGEALCKKGPGDDFSGVVEGNNFVAVFFGEDILV